MFDKSLMKLPNMKKILGMLAGIAFLQALFIIGQAFTLSMAITHLWEGNSISSQWQWLFAFLFVFLGRHIMTYLRQKLLSQYSMQQAKTLRHRLLEKMFRLGPIVVQDKGTGNMVTLALDGVDQVENYLDLILVKMINMMMIPWLILIVVFILDITSGVILLIVFPIIILFMIVLGYAAQSRADRQYKTYQLLSNHFVDSLRGIDTLKRFSLSKQYAKSIYKVSEQFRIATMKTLRIAILSSFALDFFTTLSIAVVAVFLGLRLIDGDILLFPSLCVLILAPEYFLPIRDFANDYHATLDGKNAMQAVDEVLRLSEPHVEHQDVPIWNNESHLALSDLSFHYPESEQSAVMIPQLDFIGNKKIGIIGMSGSGKSTFINLLSGFLQPQKGSIYLNGNKLSGFNEPNWQQQLSYIPQSPYIFQMTVRDNVAFYCPDATDEEIRKAIEITGLTDIIDALPQGINTMLGEGERSLSGGQAQRIALARAFLDSSRRILLFDEPTAHLDIETEVELKEKMLPLMSDHLVFFATHRLHWLNEMDYILVMDQGQLVESGTLEELIQKQGAFYRLQQTMKGEQ